MFAGLFRAPTTTPSSGLVATMIANGVTILASNTDRVSVTGQCNANRVWVLGTPGLQIQTLSCGLSQPTTTTTTTTQAARFWSRTMYAGHTFYCAVKITQFYCRKNFLCFILPVCFILFGAYNVNKFDHISSSCFFLFFVFLQCNNGNN